MITIEVLKLIDQLEALVSAGMRVPLTSRTVIDEQEFLDIIDRLRVAIPEEIKQAKRLTQERERVGASVPAEPEEGLAPARAQALERLQALQALEKDEQVISAREHAEAIVAEAQRSVEEMRAGADSYADQVLGGLEHELNKLLASVRKGRATLERSRQRADGRDSRYSGLSGSERARDRDY